MGSLNDRRGHISGIQHRLTAKVTEADVMIHEAVDGVVHSTHRAVSDGASPGGMVKAGTACVIEYHCHIVLMAPLWIPLVSSRSQSRISHQISVSTRGYPLNMFVPFYAS